MPNTPSTYPERSGISPDERNILQDMINKLEGISLKSGVDIYNDVVYQLIKSKNLSEDTKTELRIVKKGLNDGNPKYTREYIMGYLGIKISDRIAPVEDMADPFAASQARRKKMIKKPRESALAVLDPQRVEPAIVKPARIKTDAIQTRGVKSKSPKKKVSPEGNGSEIIYDDEAGDLTDNDNWLANQKWVRIAEVPQKTVARIPEIHKSPEEEEQYDALIDYLREDFLSPYNAYFPSITDISFDKFGCPVIMQSYRERLSRLDQRISTVVLDKVGDFIFKKAT